MSGRKSDTNLAEGERLGLEIKMCVLSVYRFFFLKPKTGRDHLKRRCPVLGPPGTQQRRLRSGQRHEKDVSELRKYFKKEGVINFVKDSSR